MLDLALSTLTSPPVLFFALGLFAALLRSDLALPEAVSKGLSLYLVLAIGFKGGVEMAAGASWAAAGVVLAGIALSAVLPLISFTALRATTRMGQVDAAAVAAHYGSISIVTFIAARDALSGLNVDASGHMVAVAAAMEAPAILTGLILAGRVASQSALQPAALSAATTSTPRSNRALAQECLTNESIMLLLGSFVIGWVTGERGMASVEPFVSDIFRGLLCLFLLDMGLTAGRGLIGSWRQLRPSLLVHGLMMPAVGASIALPIGLGLGLSAGDLALLMTLCASASYIAVPAALRMALPQAQLTIPLTLSLGVTFPFNLLLGIPIYIAIARAVTG